MEVEALDEEGACGGEDQVQCQLVESIDLTWLPDYFTLISIIDDKYITGYVANEDLALSLLESFERETRSHFILTSTDRANTVSGITHKERYKARDKEKEQRIFWHLPDIAEDGIPFAVGRRLLYTCEYGKATSTAKKAVKSENGGHKYLRVKPSKKVNCPAKVVCAVLFKYDDYRIDAKAPKRRKQVQMDCLKYDMTKKHVSYSTRVFMKLPLTKCHENHTVYCPTSNSSMESWVSHFTWHATPYHGYVSTFDAIETIVQQFSLGTATKYIAKYSKNFGNFNPQRINNIKSKIIFAESDDNEHGHPINLDGVPFFVSASKKLRCRQLAYTGINEDHGAYCEGDKPEENPSTQCPACVYLREVIAFPSFKVEDTSDDQKKSAIYGIETEVFNNCIEYERLFFIDFPLTEHHQHSSDAKDAVKRKKVPRSTDLFIGVDVGTGSVRAALVSASGEILTVATQDISVYTCKSDFYEQSSEEIWLAVCSCVQAITSNIDKMRIRGIGFDATCSLVALDFNEQPITVSPSGNSELNIIMWMDHRAAEQAALINLTDDEVLSYVGGTISPEMQIPKLLWLKQNMESTWENAHHYYDLPDYLTWRATGSSVRSLCSLVCKMTYVADKNGNKGWSQDFFKSIGLQDLYENIEKLGTEAIEPGAACLFGLSFSAAKDLGLEPGTAVSSSIIDAHAGALGALGCSTTEYTSARRINLSTKLAMICGTSSCHMTVSRDCMFLPGVWGPYYSVLVPGMYCNEGGQSAAGKLIDHIVENHPAYPAIKEESDKLEIHPHIFLNKFLASNPNPTLLTRNFHVWPDFHGNRSPIADPTLTGMMSGLSLSSDIEDLSLKYLATIQALAYGTKQLLEEMKKPGKRIETIVACGGLSKNPLYIQTHADVTGVPFVLPDCSESVLLGSAMLAATAAGLYSSVQDAMHAMGGSGQIIKPNPNVQSFHNKKYEVFLRMLEHQREYKDLMDLIDYDDL